MHNEPDPQLAKLLHAQLRQLPDCQAPPALVPGVLEAIRARAEVPWWRQSWWHWPLTAKVAFAACALAFVGLLASGGFWLNDTVAGYSQQVSERMAPLASTWSYLPTRDSIVASLSPYLSSPTVTYGAMIAVLSYLLCVALATACFRMTFKRA